MVPSAGSAASREMNRINRERTSVESNLKELRKQLDEYQSKLKTIKKDESRSIDALKNIRRQIQVHERLIAENQVLLENLDGELDRLQNRLASRFPHVSVVDVTQTLQTFAAVLKRMSGIVRFFAGFGIAAGILLIVSSVLATQGARIREAARAN